MKLQFRKFSRCLVFTLQSLACTSACVRCDTQSLSSWDSDLLTLFVNSYLLLGVCCLPHEMFSDVIESIPVSEYQRNLSCGQQFRGGADVRTSSVSTGQSDCRRACASGDSRGHGCTRDASATTYAARRPVCVSGRTGESRACTGVTDRPTARVPFTGIIGRPAIWRDSIATEPHPVPILQFCSLLGPGFDSDQVVVDPSRARRQLDP